MGLFRPLLSLLSLTSCLVAADPWTVRPLGSTDAPYGYLEHLPPGYVATAKAKHPLILFLHGLGELGDSDKDLPKVAKYGPLKLIADNDPLGTLIDRQGAIVIAPQGLKADKWWQTPKLIATIDSVLKRHPDIDLDRVYITGLSMGGGGTWALATAIPGRLAAVVPICGAAKPGKVDGLRDLPIWANHAIGDPTVRFPENTRAWFEAILTDRRALPAGGLTGWLAAKGGWVWAEGNAPPSSAKNPRLVLTVYPGNSHDSWTRTYQNQAMWEWMFRQVRAKKK
jgi:predicted peptidase